MVLDDELERAIDEMASELLERVYRLAAARLAAGTRPAISRPDPDVSDLSLLAKVAAHGAAGVTWRRIRFSRRCSDPRLSVTRLVASGDVIYGKSRTASGQSLTRLWALQHAPADIVPQPFTA